WAPFGGEIPIWLSLTVILVTLLVTTVASLVKSRWDEDNSPVIDDATTADPTTDEPSDEELTQAAKPVDERP
ncbi:hypothetical protein, partial [Bradyrhizobium sp. NBAIM08]|uniref:hypothetical protein n=1 Tax=Bradyrhizobium sp. NBAIM08 TaxID=2793815 RepID=UPI001CD73373